MVPAVDEQTLGHDKRFEGTDDSPAANFAQTGAASP
jgi:hypothetical protein